MRFSVARWRRAVSRARCISYGSAHVRAHAIHLHRAELTIEVDGDVEPPDVMSQREYVCTGDQKPWLKDPTPHHLMTILILTLQSENQSNLKFSGCEGLVFRKFGNKLAE